MADVIVCGNVVFDILARPVEDPLRWGGTTMVDHLVQSLGGNASSTSYTLGKLGTAVRIRTLLGRDPAGDFILNKLHSVGVDTSGAEHVAEPTSTALSLVNRKGERALLYQLGASGAAFSWPFDFRGAFHFHLAAVYRMPYLREHAPALLQKARAAGLTTSADTQWETEGQWSEVLAPSLPHLDILFVNEIEGRMITGESDPPAIARALGVPTVVVKLGEKGCFVSTGVAFTVPAFAVEVVDTTGAGDCFVGGYLAALQRGRTHQQAAHFANAVGALSVTKLGAVEAVLTYDETESWMAAQRSFAANK